ncbi:MAG TPA: efflux RND transporter periplasmic adaptor subunit [Gemmataceae bacterium]|nr:efflux RND transporter periplasmic adaptor subunit [Gemmataceae bacterium]
MIFRRRWPALLLGVTLVGCKPPSGPQAVELPPLELPVAVPLEREITDYEEYPGKVMSVERVNVMARADGYLKEIRFQPGQLVKAGDVLCVIDNRPYKASLEIAKGQLLQAQARTDRLVKEHDRIEKLIGTGAATREEFDRVTGDLGEAKATVAAAKAGVDQAQLNLEFTEVRAPITGRVGRQLVTVGNLVQGSMPANAAVLTDIVSVDKLYIYFDAPERDALRYRRLVQDKQLDRPDDGKVEVHVGLFDETGFPHRGVIDFIPEKLDAGTGTLTFRAVVQNPNQALLAEGMFARVQVAFSKPHTGLAVSDRAVVTNQGDKYLYVVNDKDTVEERPVELGRLIAPGLRQVKAGIKPGERVAVNNLQRVMPGIKVQPVPAPMPLPAGK